LQIALGGLNHETEKKEIPFKAKMGEFIL